MTEESNQKSTSPSIGFAKPEDQFYLSLIMWERTAPPDKKMAILKGHRQQNTQTARMGFVLQIIAEGNADATFRKLSRFMQRADGESYISQNRSWMKEPYKLAPCWYLEGCMSLHDKQERLRNLTNVGCSEKFISYVQDFVAGKSVSMHGDVDHQNVTKIGNASSPLWTEPAGRGVPDLNAL